MIPNRVVLDTNVCLDLFAFADPACEELLRALTAGRLEAVTRADCAREWEVVLGFPHLPFDQAKREIAGEQFARFIRLLAPEEMKTGDSLLPKCRDKADQKFLELAHDAQAAILVTKDRDLLKLAKRTARAGLFRILDIRSFSRTLQEMPELSSTSLQAKERHCRS
jgi:putative PIN family toxin of toxin-antitoxin system